MVTILLIFWKLFLLLQITGFQVITSQSITENECRVCLVKETTLPICQRRLYAPMASCIDPQSWRLSFNLKVWPDGHIPDHQSDSQSEGLNDDYGGTFTMQPSKSVLVADMGETAFVQYVTLSLNWTSNSIALQFTMDYSTDGVHWNDYVEDEQVKVFKIHWSHPIICLCRKMLTRFLRIKMANKPDFGLVLGGYLDITNCPPLVPEKPLRCEGGLGMESGEITDDQISASSSAQTITPPKVARLNRLDGTDNLQGAWVAAHRDEYQWLQIDLKVPHTGVTRVATQGRNRNSQWVTKYKLQYGNDEVNFQYYREQGQITNKEFVGNNDRDTAVYHDLIPQIAARYIRFRPMEWHVWPAMRVELYGCRDELYSYITPTSISAVINDTIWYAGCFNVTKNDAGLIYSGLVSYSEIDQKACLERCSSLNSTYAAIQSGLLCFCTNVDPSSPMDNEFDCMLPYFSVWSPDQVAMRYYRVPSENIAVKSLSKSHSRRRIGELLTISASVNKDEVNWMKFTFHPGDGNELVFCDSPITHFYKNPGTYSLSMTIEDAKGNKLSFNDSILIADNLTQFDFTCPRGAPQGHAVDCTIEIARSLNVTGKLNVENKMITLQEIPDSWMSGFGEEVLRHVPATSAMLEELVNKTERLYVLTKNPVQEEGYVANLELNVLQAGPVHVQIVRHKDDTEMSYTSRSHIVCTLECTEQSRTFSMDRGCCSSSSCEPLGCSFGMSPDHNLFIAADIIMAQHVSEGYHSIDFTNVTRIRVLPGDMLGWYSSSFTGKVAAATEASNDRGVVFEGVTDGLTAGLAIGAGLQRTAFNWTFGLRANVVPLSTFEASFNLEEIAQHQVTVSVSDNFGNMENSSAEILCQQAILGLTLDYPEFALMENIPIELSITNGTNVSYIVHFGDDQVEEINQTSVTLNSTLKGVQKLTVIAFNDISTAVIECRGPYILASIKDISILPVEPLAVNQSFSITVSILQGNLVNLNVSLGDESPAFNVSNFDVNDTFVVVKNHSYRNAGVYLVKAFATNDLSNSSAQISVTVQATIAGLQISTPQGVHSSEDDLVINMSVTQGTDVQYEVTLDDENKTANGSNATLVFPKDLLQAGLALLTVKAYNLVSHTETTKNISIQTPIFNARFWLHSRYKAIKAGIHATFAIYYGRGSSLSITLWKGTVEPGITVGPHGEEVTILLDVFYPDPGVYTARVNFSNALGWVTPERTIIVQQPVKDIEIVTDSPRPFPPGVVNVAVRQIGVIATNATLKVSYGDGTTVEGLNFTGEFNSSHRYSTLGDYQIVVDVRNLASNESMETAVSVLKTVTFLIIKVTTYADELSTVSFSSASGDTFPVEFPVILGAEYDQDVNISQFHYNFGDGSPSVTSANNTAEHSYDLTGEFIVTITLKHQFGEFSNSTKVYMKESIVGLKIRDDAPAVVKQTTNFTFNVDTLGTNTLIKVDFGDGQTVFFGENDGNVDISSTEIFRTLSALATNFTFQHAYKEEGLYVVNVHGWNEVSSIRLSHHTHAMEKECRYPDPHILSVGANPDTAPNVTRDREIVVYAKIIINCKASYETGFEWKVEYQPENESVPVNIHTDFNKPSLTIPPYSLPYGTIELRLTAEMKHSLGEISGHSIGYINVLSADLKAEIFGGNFRTVSSLRHVIINGSISEDPDVGRGNLSGIQFFWLCRQDNESFSENTEDLPRVRFKEVSQHNVNGGCEGSGPRMLQYSTPELIIAPGMLREDEKYVIKLVIRKDTRESTFEQTLEVFENVIPEVATKCEINCHDKVNVNNRLSVIGICVNCAQEGFTSESYRWEMHVQNESTGGWTPVVDLDSKTLIGSTESSIVLRHDVLHVGKKYKLTCRVKNEGGLEGRSEHHFTTNTPPQKGICNVSPTEGKVLETYFKIECSGWHDEDSALMYKVLLGESLLRHGQDPKLPPSLLPQSPRQNNNTYNLTVKVFDKYNSFSEETLLVTVREANLTTEEVQSLISEDGLLTNMLISGDTQGVAQLVTSVSTILDNQADQEKLNQDSSKGGDGEPTFEDNEAKEARVKIKEDLLGVLEDLEPESMDTAGVLIEAMSSLTSNVEELSSKAQKSMLSVLTKALTTLSVKKSADSLAAIESVSKGMVGNLGNLFGASKHRQGSSEQDQSEDTTKQARNMTKAAMKLLDDILDILVAYQAAGQEPALLLSDRMSALVSKVDHKALAGSSYSIGTGSFVLPSNGDVVGSWADEDCYLVAKGINAKDNPYIWDESSSEVNSNCLGLKFEDCHGTTVNVMDLQEPIAITVPRDEAGELPESGNFTIQENTMTIHKLHVEGSGYSINAVVHPEAVNCTHEFKIFLRENTFPTTEEFDFNWTMRVIPGIADWRQGFPLSVSNFQLNRSSSDKGVYYLGLYLTRLDESRTEEKCSGINYKLFSFLSSCNFWDELEEKWKASGCEVAPQTTYFSTVCHCTHLTNFGGGFLVAPNPIDFDKAFSGFSDIASNPVVFATVLTIFGLYFVGVIWARWRDKEDLEKIGVTPLLSNDPRDTYGYEITLQTGFQQKSRTTADVFIQLFGTLSDSEPRMLKDPKRPKFGRGEIDQFLLTVPQSLGNVKEIHIWHNNAGKSPAWYLFRVLIRDLQTESKWWFVCDQWLAVEEGDGAVDRRLKQATKEELTKFNILFVNATRKNLLDGHLWLSVFTRPPKSTFTRVQRLSCCLSLMLTTMLANLMFYQTGADDTSNADQSIHVGPFILSARQIIIGVQSSFVVLPVNMIIVSIFRKLKPKEDNSNSKKYEQVDEETNYSNPDLTNAESSGNVDSSSQVAYINSTKDSRDNSVKKTFNWKTLLSFIKKDDDSDYEQKKSKKKFLFPYWCIYIAYVLVAVSSLTCGFFCMLYGFTFGKERSEKWLTSMLVSFFQSVVVIQPFKVLLIAAFFALIIKDPNKEEEQEDVPGPGLNADEEFIETSAEREPRNISLQSKPPDAKKLEAARRLRLKQCEMKAIIKEIITHFLVVGIVLTVAYGNHDNRSFAMSNEVQNVLVAGDPSTTSFDTVNRRELFWDWATTTLIESLFPSTASHEYPYVGIFKSDEVSNVLGVGRIRQIRMKKDTCQVPKSFSKYITECNDVYSWSEEERGSFGIGWSIQSQENVTESKKPQEMHPASPWQYQSVMEASSFPYLGKMASYRGGGFIIELGRDKVTALNELKELETKDWIDRYTRALFTELSIYNININLLCVVTLLYEELPTGGGQTFVNIQTIRVYRYIGNFSAALMTCEVIFAFLLLNWILRDGKRLWRERISFWKKAWNVVDIAITALSITSLSLYFARLVFLNSAVGKLREDPSKFVSFQYVVVLDEGVNAMVALVVLLINLKFLRMLRFNRKVSVLSSTMKVSANKLASFMLMFLVIFLAYCFVVYLVFGPVLEDYRTFIRCMVSMMAMVLGNFAFYDLVDVSVFFGPAVFFTFMVLVQFILINIFIGILCDSFNEVRYDSEKQGNEYEIVQFISNRIKAFVGLFVEPPIRPEYSWPKSELEKKVETIEEKAESTMFFMRTLCDEDVRQLRWFQPEKWSRKKSKVMSLVLSSDAEILEDDLCDGIEAMNAVVDKYSEHELDRMIAASRMKRRIESEATSLISTSRMSGNEEDFEDDDPESDDELTQENLGEGVLKVQELKSLQYDLKDVLENDVEEPGEESEEDEKESEEVEWEEELELVEESLENTDSSVNCPASLASSTFINSAVSLISMSPSFTEVSIRKSSISMRSVPPLAIAEENEDTEDSIDESRSQLGDIEKDVLHQDEDCHFASSSLAPHSLPDAEVLDRKKGSTPMDMLAESTSIFIPESDDNTGEGSSDNDDFIIDGRVLRVLPSSQSDA